MVKNTEGDLRQKKKQAERELSAVIARNETVEHLYEKIYEDNAEGKVSDEWFAHMSRKYELDDEAFGEIYQARTREGVSVNYLTCKLIDRPPVSSDKASYEIAAMA